MRFSTILSLILIAYFQIGAQSNIVVQNSLKNINNPNAVGIQTSKDRIQGIKGSPFLFGENWLDGSLLLKNGQELSENIQFKFNAYGNELVVKSSRSPEKVLYNNTINSFKLKDGKEEYTFRRLPIEKNPNTLCQLVFEGQQLELVKLPSKILRQGKQDDYSGQIDDNEYIYKENFYIKTFEGNYKKVKLSKKGLLKVFPKFKNELIELMDKKDEKINEQTIIHLLEELEKLP